MSSTTTAVARTPEELIETIGQLLDEEKLVAAQRAAARAVELFKDHPWIRRANKVLNPSRVCVEPRPQPDRNRKKEIDWLHHNSDQFRGRWVALLEDRLVASANSFEDLLAALTDGDLESHPLIHHIG